MIDPKMQLLFFHIVVTTRPHFDPAQFPADKTLLLKLISTEFQKEVKKKLVWDSTIVGVLQTASSSNSTYSSYASKISNSFNLASNGPWAPDGTEHPTLIELNTLIPNLT